MATLSEAAKARVEEWTSAKYDAATRGEIQALMAAGNVAELEDRFYKTISFGTGGLRGKLGAGTNRMNAYIVARATQGLANYVRQNAEKPGPLRVAIAHDCRHGSREFARATAEVFAANGFLVHISPDLRPTPYCSFAMRHLDCHTGVVVTASHNPKEYNGYKAYWDDGSQVVPPHDAGIIAEVNAITDDSQVHRIRFEDGVARGQIKVMGAEMDEAYLAAVLKQRISPDLIARFGPKIVYTPLHGAGATMGVKALRQWGFKDVLAEPEQMIPNGDFPTAASPNPEEGAALSKGVEFARKNEYELVIATDPDADRIGAAVLHQGEFHLLNGNQLSTLLCDYVLGQRKEKGLLPAKAGAVTTVVTTPLVKRVAESHGVECPLVLTGFKWIALQIREWIASGGPTFVFGTEESHGFMIGDHCRDKDGIVATCALAEAAALARSKGRTLIDELMDVYVRFGVHYEWQKSITLPGKEGALKIAAMLESVGKNPPTAVGARKVVRFTRLDTGEVFEGGKLVRKLNYSVSDVFTFDLEDGSRAIMRPSGTEPKIKFYFFLSDQAKPADTSAAWKRLAELKSTAPAFEREVLTALGIEN